MRIQKSTDKEDFGRKGLFRADSTLNIYLFAKIRKLKQFFKNERICKKNNGIGILVLNSTFLL
ncbi:MAG: hypothetical protein JJU02_06550 [Cryomorphaceae bacterium]|nr:hypothetical protein [Cryomorphaceae bacterium]